MTIGAEAADELEQALVEHVTRGDPLDLAFGKVVDQEAMPTWDASRTIRASVLRDILLGRLAPVPDPHGLRLRGARIAGRLDLGSITTEVAVQLVDCFLEEGLDATNAVLPFLGLVGCRLEGSYRSPLDAGQLTAAAGLSIASTLITANCVEGAVRLIGARVGGQMSASGARICNDRGPALDASDMQVARGLFLADGFTAIGAGEAGAVRLAGARLGHLSCANGTIHNDSGPAMHADYLQIDESLRLSGSFDAIGAGEDGAIRLLGAHVGSQFSCDGARIRNDSGPALCGDSLRVREQMRLTSGFTAIGAGEDGAVRLPAAELGRLVCDNATISNDSGPALNAQSVRVHHDVLIRRLEMAGGDDAVTLDLTDARVGGSLRCGWEQSTTRDRRYPRIAVDGLTYAGVPVGIEPSEWLQLLAKATPEYAPQPYQQLANAHRAAGHDGQARAVLMAQRRDQIRRRALTGRGERAWTRLIGLTLGYGYQPWRALLLLLATVLVAAVVALQLGAHGALAHSSRSLTPGQPCDRVERLGVGIDLGLPLIKTSARDRCDLTTDSTAAQALTIAGWSLQLLAWASATLFIAGFTSAVRKP
jgi:hypothetical protein